MGFSGRDDARGTTYQRDIALREVPDEIAPAIDAAKASEAAALDGLASPLLFANRQVIIERTVALRLPAKYPWPEDAEQGGFIGYGARVVQLYREIMARQLVKLPRGAKPADLDFC